MNDRPLPKAFKMCLDLTAAQRIMLTLFKEGIVALISLQQRCYLFKKVFHE